ncbi:MAG: DEAD/DEAH box helicase [Akkermansiaceae bacterium]|nr:DEAD/DEAH box helicase [Akkermansiaceae bacterium]
MSDSSAATDYLRSGDWQHRFEEEILAAARPMAGKSKAIRLEGLGGGSHVLRGEVKGEQVEVSFWPSASGWEMEASCSCELGQDCHHAAGLLAKAAKSRDLQRLAGSGLNTAVQGAIDEARQEKTTGDKTPVGERIAPPPRFELAITRSPVDPHSRLILKSLGQADAEQCIFADAFVIYEGHRLPLRGSRPDWISELTDEDGKPLVLQHDKAAENAAARLLSDSGLSSLDSNSAWQFLIKLRSREADAKRHRWFPDPERIQTDLFWHRFRGEWVRRLEEAGWTVSIGEQVGHAVYLADPDDWQTEMQPCGGGWFDLSVGFEVGSERHDLLPILAELLENELAEDALEGKGQAFVYAPLPNGDALQLPVDRVRRILGHLALLIDPDFPEQTKVHALDAAALSTELALDAPAEIQDLAQRLGKFESMEKVAPPEGLQATLRDYQLAGFHWMQFLARHALHGILADDMGLGKTLQTLAHILEEKSRGHSQGRPTLVIAPTSVVPNWQAEAQKFTPELKVLVLEGPGRHRHFASIPHADIVLSSYALLHRDIDEFADHDFHLAILDEAQHIKNPQAKVAQAACRLQARHRLCLSGTPVENHLGELWSLMRFLMPGWLGKEEDFMATYRKPGDDPDLPKKLAELRARVAPLILRRTKDQVATELPPKTELVHRIELHRDQKDLYETVRAMMNKRVRQAIAARGGSQYQIVFLDALLKLRQICCHPALLPDNFEAQAMASAKLDFLGELLEVLVEEGRRILIFSQFTTMLERIEALLERERIGFLKLTGESKDRGSLVERFQGGDVPVFLISLKAGGTGLNLTAADTVIHFDPWWNPAAQAQATDRAYRIGQDKPVFVHKLLCRDTVEERIHQLQQDKAKLAADLLEEADIVKRLGPQMMQDLLGGIRED